MATRAMTASASTLIRGPNSTYTPWLLTSFGALPRHEVSAGRSSTPFGFDQYEPLLEMSVAHSGPEADFLGFVVQRRVPQPRPSDRPETNRVDVQSVDVYL